MNREQAKALLPIITAFAEGKDIEVKYAEGTWGEVSKPSFDSGVDRYRIKQTSTDYLIAHNASGLQVGDMVRVTRKAETKEQGWGNSWDADMDQYVGKVMKVTANHGVLGFDLDHGPSFPYFVLEKVVPKYRPFKNAEEFKPHRDRWVVRKDSGSLGKVIFYEDTRIMLGGAATCIGYGMLLSFCTFDDGSPCGVEYYDTDTSTGKSE